MGGVGAAVDADLPVVTPGRAAVRHVVQGGDVVQILALGVVGLAEKTGLDQSLHQHVWLHVHVVLGHHVDGVAAVAGLNQPAALFD